MAKTVLVLTLVCTLSVIGCAKLPGISFDTEQRNYTFENGTIIIKPIVRNVK